MSNSPIPYSTQWIDEEDIQAVIDVLKSDWITQGPTVESFEKQLADYCDAKYAVAVSSGTAALHLACVAAGIQAGDRVLTSPISFVASANCVLFTGGEPRFVDIDAGTHNISTGALEEAMVERPMKAIIPVHFSGLPCDMEKIDSLAKNKGSFVIEDACHALGARYQDSNGEWVKVGSCRHSDMTVFSFHPVKHITTGEGGAVTTNDQEIYEKLCRLRAHGITKDPSKWTYRDGDRPWYYEMLDLGYNYRITDFQCALGATQLAKLDARLERRAEIARCYDAAFSDIDAITRRGDLADRSSAHHLYVLEVDDRDEIYLRLRAMGIRTQVHYIPIHLQPFYRNTFGYTEGDYPNSEAYYKRCISIPMFPKLSDDDVEMVISAVKDVVA